MLSCHNSLWSFLLTKLYILYRHPLNSINEQVDTRSYRGNGRQTESIASKTIFYCFKKVKRLYITDNVSIFPVDVCYKPEIYKG